MGHERTPADRGFLPDFVRNEYYTTPDKSSTTDDTVPTTCKNIVERIREDGSVRILKVPNGPKGDGIHAVSVCSESIVNCRKQADDCKECFRRCHCYCSRTSVCQRCALFGIKV